MVVSQHTADIYRFNIVLFVHRGNRLPLRREKTVIGKRAKQLKLQFNMPLGLPHEDKTPSNSHRRGRISDFAQAILQNLLTIYLLQKIMRRCRDSSNMIRF